MHDIFCCACARRFFRPGLVFVVVGALLLAAPSPALAQAAVGEPTFTRDVLPILQRACQQCHRPGSVAPMALLTYEQVRP
ncbi:MAG: hypothetical protein OXF27_17865, partial [Acidobacteria bacterium]|nr:hypothetical protein [Acidobacteriota bacterium]